MISHVCLAERFGEFVGNAPTVPLSLRVVPLWSVLPHDVQQDLVIACLPVTERMLNIALGGS